MKMVKNAYFPSKFNYYTFVFNDFDLICDARCQIMPSLLFIVHIVFCGESVNSPR